MTEQERELWVPADRLAPILRLHRGPWTMLRGNDRRRATAILSGEQVFLSLTVTDRILVALGLDEWFHYRREDGGLADIYEDGVQYGAPRGLVPVLSESERVLRCRRSWRESKRRARLREVRDAA